jgi:hypothetical protein
LVEFSKVKKATVKVLTKLTEGSVDAKFIDHYTAVTKKAF